MKSKIISKVRISEIILIVITIKFRIKEQSKCVEIGSRALFRIKCPNGFKSSNLFICIK